MQKKEWERFLSTEYHYKNSRSVVSVRQTAFEANEEIRLCRIFIPDVDVYDTEGGGRRPAWCSHVVDGDTWRSLESRCGDRKSVV